MHLAGLKPYIEADHKLTAPCADCDAWTHKGVLNWPAAGILQRPHDRPICRRDLGSEAVPGIMKILPVTVSPLAREPTTLRTSGSPRAALVIGPRTPPTQRRLLWPLRGGM